MNEQIGKARMKDINIVLIEPLIHANTGNIARTCAVTGASLHLVKPLGFSVDDRHLKRAGLDYWDKLNITYYESTADFFDKNRGETMYFFSAKGKYPFSCAEYPDRVFIVFGREDTGLDEKIIRENYENTLRIPMREGVRCLNLSNSAAIAVYEILRRDGYPGLDTNVRQNI